jgi:hypothetical protein
MHCGFLATGGAGLYTTRSIKTGMASAIKVVSFRIGIMNRAVYMPNCGVISKVATFPPATIKTAATITKSIINSAVITNTFTPIASMPSVVTAIKSPVTGCP